MSGRWSPRQLTSSPRTSPTGGFPRTPFEWTSIAYPTTPSPYDRRVTATLTILAYAKVNLALAVGPPEPAGAARPGWHPIASWMACIDLADELTLTHHPDRTLSTYTITWAADALRPTPIDWPIEKDLAHRAHRLVEQYTGRPLPVDLRLAKRIPVGGGLGGGSSDAAAMLTGLNELFELGIPLEKLQRLGAQLGSDVAFFVDDRRPARPAIIKGFGEYVERVPQIAERLLLIIPPVSCPTREVYAAYDQAVAAGWFKGIPGGHPALEESARLIARVRGIIDAALRNQDLEHEPLINSLEGAATVVQPRLLHTMLGIRLLYNGKIRPIITGSGSCFFIVLPRHDFERFVRRITTWLADIQPSDDPHTPLPGCLGMVVSLV